jgi:hypothetical protein
MSKEARYKVGDIVVINANCPFKELVGVEATIDRIYDKVLWVFNTSDNHAKYSVLLHSSYVASGENLKKHCEGCSLDGIYALLKVDCFYKK